MNYTLRDMKVFGDERGKLISLESEKNIPFNIKRVYWIYDTAPDQDRGMHAHKNMEQIIVAIDGACQFILDDGKTREKPSRPRTIYWKKHVERNETFLIRM